MKETCKPSIGGIRYNTIEQLKQAVMSGPRALIAKKLFDIYTADTDPEKGSMPEYVEKLVTSEYKVRSQAGILKALSLDSKEASERDIALSTALYVKSGAKKLEDFKAFLGEDTTAESKEALAESISRASETKSSAKINSFTLNQFKKKLEQLKAKEFSDEEDTTEYSQEELAKKQAALLMLDKIDDNAKILIKDERGNVVNGLYKWYFLKTTPINTVADLLEQGRIVEDTSEAFGLKWFRYYKKNEDGTKTYIESDPSYRKLYEATVSRASTQAVTEARTQLILEMQKKDSAGNMVWNTRLPETILPSYARESFNLAKGVSISRVIGTDGNEFENAYKFFSNDKGIKERFAPFVGGDPDKIKLYYASRAAREVFGGVNTLILDMIKNVNTKVFSPLMVTQINNIINQEKNKEITNIAKSFIKSLDVILAHIPGQSKQSGIPARVVEFLDAQGNMAMAPTESMVTTGGDYDIDTFSIATYALDSLGKVVMSSEDLYAEGEYDKNTLVNIYKRSLERIDSNVREKIGYLNSTIDAYISTLDPVKDIGKIKQAEKSKKSEDDIELIIKRAEKELHNTYKDILSNRVVDAMVASLADVKTAVETNTAISMDLFKPIIKQLETRSKSSEDGLLTRFSGENSTKVTSSEDLAAQGDVSIGTYATTLKITGAGQTAEMYFNHKYNKRGKNGSYKEVYNPFKFVFDLEYTDYNTGLPVKITRNKFVDNDRFAITQAIVNDEKTLHSIFNVVSSTGLVTENVDALINILVAEIQDAGIKNIDELNARVKSLYEIDLPIEGNEDLKDMDDLLNYLREHLIANPDSVSKAFVAVIGKPIGTDAQSQFLSAATDNAKELILGRIRATTLTNGAITTMLVLGYDVSTIIDFIHDKDVDAVYREFEKKVGEMTKVNVTSSSVSKLKGINQTSKSVKTLKALLDISSQIQVFRGVRSLNENSTVDTSEIESILNSFNIENLREAILTDNYSLIEEPDTDAKKVFSPAHMVFLQPQARYMFDTIVVREKMIDALFKSMKVSKTIMKELKRTPEAYKNIDRHVYSLQLSNFYEKPIKEEEGNNVYRTGTVAGPSGRYVKLVPLNTHQNRAEFVQRFGDYLSYAIKKLRGVDQATIDALGLIVPGAMSRVDVPVYYMPKLKNISNSVDTSIAISALKQLQASSGDAEVDKIKKELYNNLSNYALIVSSGSIKKGSMIEAFDEITLEFYRHIETLTTADYAKMVPEDAAVKVLVAGDILSESQTEQVKEAAEKSDKRSYSDEDFEGGYGDDGMGESDEYGMGDDVMGQDDDGNSFSIQPSESAKRLNRVVHPSDILIGSIFTIPAKFTKNDLFYAHNKGAVAYRLFKVKGSEALPGTLGASSTAIPGISPEFIQSLEKTPYRIGYPVRYNGQEARVLAYTGPESVTIDGDYYRYQSYQLITKAGMFKVAGEVLAVQNPGHLFYKNAIQPTSVANKFLAKKQQETIDLMKPEGIAKLSNIHVEIASLSSGKYKNAFTVEDIRKNPGLEDEVKAFSYSDNVIDYSSASNTGLFDKFHLFTKAGVHRATDEDVDAIIPSVDNSDSVLSSSSYELMNNLMSESFNRINDILPGKSFYFYGLALPEANKAQILQSAREFIKRLNRMSLDPAHIIPEDIFFSIKDKASYRIGEDMSIEIKALPGSNMYEMKITREDEPASGDYTSQIISNGNGSHTIVAYEKSIEDPSKLRILHNHPLKTKIDIMSRGIFPDVTAMQADNIKTAGFTVVRVSDDEIYLIKDRDRTKPEYFKIVGENSIKNIDSKPSDPASSFPFYPKLIENLKAQMGYNGDEKPSNC